MKRYFIITGLILLLTTQAHAVKNTYLQRNPTTVAPSSLIYRPIYNPYYYNQYRRVNSNNLKRIRRMQRIRQMNRLRRNYYPYLSWFNNNNNQGNLTGYSVPVTSDIYSQMGITPYNKAPNQNTNSINCDTDLFSSPQGDEMYYTNGEYIKDIQGATGKTGVTIIYD